MTLSAASKVGIVYLTFATPDWERDIHRCLSSLEKMNYPRDRVELICVESHSNHGRVKEWFEKTWMPKSGKDLPHIVYLFNDEMIGFAGNNNIGFEKAKELGCEFVYLLNEDTEVDPDFLREAVRRAESDQAVALVQSFLLLGQDKSRVNTVGNAFHFLGFGYSNGYGWTRERALRHFDVERHRNPDLEIGYASGAGVLVRVSAVEKCGGLFDKNFFSYHEDTDLSLRARACGYKVVVEPRSIVFHYYEFVKTQLKKNYWIERNRFALLMSFYRPLTFLVILPMWFIMEVAQFFFSLYGGWWREKLKVYREIASNEFWAWIKERLFKIQKLRRVSDRDLLRFAVATIEFQGDGVKNPVLDRIGNPVMRAYWWAARQLII